MDWKDSLLSLKDSLPEGEEMSQPATEEKQKKLPRLDVVLDRKGRKGKDATIIVGFDPDDETVNTVATTLKQRLGTGGSVRDGEILIQGDKRRQVLELLQSLGYKARII